MPKRPTQADVAKLAGVSRATVSYVLNNRTGGRIRITQETRQKVSRAIQEVGYEPHALARSLRSGLSQVIGLLIPDTHNPLYLDIVAGVEDEAIRCDYYVVLVSVNLDPERERHCLRSLSQRRLDGLILSTTSSNLPQKEVQTLLERSGPIVFLGPHVEGDNVYEDRASGAEALMDHLISLGHRRIGFIDGVAFPGQAEHRTQVYGQKIAALGLSVSEQLLRNCGPTIQDGYAAAQELLDLAQPPTAIWAVNDLLAIGALRAIRERGLCVPEDISLAGFDDIAFASQVYPPLTTVRIHAEQLGRQAARMLFQRIKDPGREPMQEVIDTELVIRQSTAAARAGQKGHTRKGGAPESM
jgi:LacI family transcriptional regulator